MDFRIGTRRIGPGQPVFIVAEAGVTTMGALDFGAPARGRSCRRKGRRGEVPDLPGREDRFSLGA